MNKWIQLSIEYANKRNYLDNLFEVYPIKPEEIRKINGNTWKKIKTAFEKKDNNELIKALLELKLFPIKDSYVAFLRRNKISIEKNPKTVNRICDILYKMGLDEIYRRASEPKETNRQIGPMFKEWVKKKSLGIQPVTIEEFKSNNNDAILDASDEESMIFAKEHLGYNHDKGIDFLARFNGKYILGEAKFLTDFGGHQNAQFNDAVKIFELNDINAIKIAILDGVLYIEGNSKMHKSIKTKYKDCNIMSALLLKKFIENIKGECNE
jgi:hypothetical protein